MFNPSLSRMHPWKRRELIGKPFAMTVAPEVQPELPFHHRLVDDREYSVCESLYIRKDREKKFPAFPHRAVKIMGPYSAAPRTMALTNASPREAKGASRGGIVQVCASTSISGASEVALAGVPLHCQSFCLWA
jgi:hypothetical protein